MTAASIWGTFPPEVIGFPDAEKGVCREEQAPYYYVDLAEKKVRLVFVQSGWYNNAG